MTYRTDYNFGVQYHNGSWVLVCAPSQDAPHCRELMEAERASKEWAARNRAKFRSGS